MNEVCDNCAIRCDKVYHSKRKDYPADWYECFKCLNEEE